MKVTKKKRIRKKRRASVAEQTSGGRHKALRDLGADRWAMVMQYFLEGRTASHIARVIQNEWGELGDVEFNTLCRQLRRLKDEEVNPKIMTQGQLLPADVQARIVKQMKGHLDTIDEMTAICMDATANYKTLTLHAQQTNRIADAKAATDAGKQTLTMLKDLASVQMEAGIIPRAPRVVSAHVNFQRTAAEDAYLADVRVRKERSTRARRVLDMLQNDDAIDAEFEEVADIPIEEDDAPFEDD